MATDVKNSSLATDLVSYWELEETSGTRVDSHGSNDLTDVNTVGSVAAIEGNGASFTRANTESLVITDGDQTGLDETSDLSIACWFRLDTLPASGSYSFVQKYDSTTGNRSYYFDFLKSGATYGLNSTFHTGSGGIGAYRSGTFSTGTWYHAAVTFKAGSGTSGEVKFYIDGTQLGTTATGDCPALQDVTQDFRVGANSDNATGHIDGDIDELGFWSRTLSSTDISDLYNSGSGIPYDAGGGGSTFTPKMIIM